MLKVGHIHTQRIRTLCKTAIELVMEEGNVGEAEKDLLCDRCGGFIPAVFNGERKQRLVGFFQKERSSNQLTCEGQQHDAA
jgi:hypothetical protein